MKKEIGEGLVLGFLACIVGLVYLWQKPNDWPDWPFWVISGGALILMLYASVRKDLEVQNREFALALAKHELEIRLRVAAEQSTRGEKMTT